jgi:hypothetical protein
LKQHCEQKKKKVGGSVQEVNAIAENAHLFIVGIKTTTCQSILYTIISTKLDKCTNRSVKSQWQEKYNVSEKHCNSTVVCGSLLLLKFKGIYQREKCGIRIKGLGRK